MFIPFNIPPTFEKNIKEKKSFIFAYPTEAVYGLGCNPFDQAAVNRIIHLKGRTENQRFILIASDWEQILPFIQSTINPDLFIPVKASWPGPITWVFPAAKNTPAWLINTNNTIALRITAHPIAQALCRIAGHPLISTSANFTGNPPCKTFEEATQTFAHHVDQIIPGEVDLSLKPTPIRDVLTGVFLRV